MIKEIQKAKQFSRNALMKVKKKEMVREVEDLIAWDETKMLLEVKEIVNGFRDNPTPLRDQLQKEQSMNQSSAIWQRISRERKARGEHEFWTITRFASINSIDDMKITMKRVIETEKIDKGSDYHHKMCLLVQ